MTKPRRPPKALLGEEARDSWFAVHTTEPHGRWRTEGRLWLTPTRLVFVPVAYGKLLQRLSWSCALGSVDDVEIAAPEPWALNREPRGRLRLRSDGRTDWFQVRNPEEALAAIRTARSE